MNCFKIFIIFFMFISFLYSTSKAIPELRGVFCPNATIFTQNSTYHSNRNQLLSSLSSNATRETGYYNTTVGREPDLVYGSLMCRGDLNQAECKNCTDVATQTLVQTECPDEKTAIIWYSECMVRYSDENFFGVMAKDPMQALYNAGDINNPERFAQLIARVLNESVIMAVQAATGSKRFGTREQHIRNEIWGFSELQTLYTLVQCTPDISPSDCDRCLRGAVAHLPVCCGGARGANVFSPNCNIRFEIYKFYNVSAVSPPSGTPPQLGPSSTPPQLTESKNNGTKNSAPIVVSVSVSVAAMLSMMMLLGFFWVRRRQQKRRARNQYNAVRNDQSETEIIATVDSLQYNLEAIAEATNNFSVDNKLGEGGFGSVYKGVLVDEKEIAVKRLSKSSVQGGIEFKNEVVLVAKLQHRNLVRLLGFCLEGDEKLLVYEYVPNKSLDYFLYDPKKKDQLNWSTRCNIIDGIARGVMYLHEDSRLKIIHRDLKPSNILLDNNLNAKVSDFGMAKMVGVDQTQGNTKRVVGTYGYMAPEYAMEGLYSIKSDIYSFGVLLLEIVSGRKNSSFHISDRAPSLIAYAWQLWNENSTIELMDPSLKGSCHEGELLRYIQIGLLCVQEDASFRPTMSSVILMLKSETQSLSQPQRPAFIARTHDTGRHEIIAANSSSSLNDITASDFLPR